MKGQNKWLWGAGALSVVMTSVVVLIEPIAKTFGMTNIGFSEYAIAILLGFTIIPVVELIKVFYRIYDKKHNC
jgi:Ca2+-transporting ATPase